MSDHLSAHVLERRALKLLDGDRAKQADDHLAGCDSCRARLAELEKEQSAFVAEKDPQLFARRVLARAENAKPESRSRWAWMLGLLAPAMAMGVLLLVRAPVDPYIGVKGEVKLQLLTPAGPLAEGAVVHAGAALRFSVGAPHAGQLLIVGLNSKGELFPYYPLQGTQSVPQAAGQPAPLPGSVVLDDTLGHERFYALLTDSPLTVAELKSAVAAGHTQWTDATLPVHAEQASASIDKQPAK